MSGTVAPLVPIPEWLAGVILQVGDYIKGITDRVGTAVQTLVTNAGIYLGGLNDYIRLNILPSITNIGTGIQTLASGVIGDIKTIATDVGDKLKEWTELAFDNVAAIAGDVAAGILDFKDKVAAGVTSALGGVGEQLSGLWANVTSTINDTQRIVRAWFGDAIYIIRTYVGDALNSLVGFVEPIVSGLRTAVTEVIGAAKAVYGDVKTYVAGLVGDFTRVVGDGMKAITDGVTALVTPAIQNAGALYDSIQQRVQELKADFGTAASDLAVKLSGIAGENIGPLRDSFIQLAGLFIDMSGPKAVAEATQKLQMIAGDDSLVVRDRAAFRRLWEQLTPESPLLRVIWGAAFIVPLLLRTYYGVMDAQAQVVLQEFAQTYSYQLLSPADGQQAMRRGTKSREAVLLDIQKQGYTPSDAEVILDNTEAVPPVGDLVSMRLRDIITDQTYQRALYQHGFDSAWRNAVTEIGKIIPPVGDLITMAVREVFDARKAEQLGLFEEFPADFGRWTEKQGLSQVWAQRYWAAHWQLPSATQGFEMLQRGIITPDELDGLLKALDYSPVWRSKLRDISYNPLTRVDVRRMHALGVIDDKDLEQAYRDQGYNLIDALRLAEFTKRLSRGAIPDDDDELGKITRANILKFYDDGLIPRERAANLLVDGGQTPSAAELYLSNVDFENQRAERKAEIDLTLELAEAGVLTYTEAQDRLNALKLETTEVQKALAQLLRNEQRNTKLPTRTEAADMVSAGVITLADYEALLQRLKYPEFWTNAFVSLAKKKGGARKA